MNPFPAKPQNSARSLARFAERLALCAVVSVVAAVSGMAGEYAVLGNGFRIQSKSHEIIGDRVRLHTAQGDIEMPAANVTGFEQEDYTPPAAPEPPAVAAPAPAPANADPKQMVSMAADAAGLPRALVHSLVRAESGYQVNAISPKGAIGLMQLMPATAAALNANPRNPLENAYAGAMYLRELLLKYKDTNHQVTRAVAAYNAGPGAVDKYRGVPPYRETRDYVRRVVSRYNKETGQDGPEKSKTARARRAAAPAAPQHTD